ncbi:MAG: winged helix-turn-helix transcriptional regulator [Acidimicrobiales bacterium]
MDDQRYCPHFHHTVELLGRRWSGVILWVLVAGPARFGEIRDRIPGLSDRLLTSRLAEFEAEGLVKRCDHDGASCYRLTEKGRALEPVIDAITTATRTWAAAEAPATKPGRIRT